jgi:hypothetical protein
MMNEDMLAIADQWVPLAGFVLNGLLVVIFFVLKKTFVSREDYDAGQSQLVEAARGMESRLTEVEMRLESMPGPAAVQELLVSQARIEGKIEAMGERTAAMESNIKLLMRVHTGDGR